MALLSSRTVCPSNSIFKISFSVRATHRVGTTGRIGNSSPSRGDPEVSTLADCLVRVRRFTPGLPAKTPTHHRSVEDKSSAPPVQGTHTDVFFERSRMSHNPKAVLRLRPATHHLTVWCSSWLFCLGHLLRSTVNGWRAGTRLPQSYNCHRAPRASGGLACVPRMCTDSMDDG